MTTIVHLYMDAGLAKITVADFKEILSIISDRPDRASDLARLLSSSAVMLHKQAGLIEALAQKEGHR